MVMECHTARAHLGPLLDGELPAADRAAVESHVSACAACSAERDRLAALIGDIEASDVAGAAGAPPELWAAVERRMSERSRSSVLVRLGGLTRRPMASAASVALLVGAGLVLGFWLMATPPTAYAGTVDYSVLLDGLADDVDTAIGEFLEQYDGRPIRLADAASAASGLSFAIPASLPGGFELRQTYALTFAVGPGIAARYERGAEPLVVFFHAPVDRPIYGMHVQSTCMVAGRHGHSVEVGAWRLVHFTDPTTCHCVLSTLDVQTELPAVLEAIAPSFKVTSPGG